MKKLFAFATAVSLLLTLAACGCAPVQAPSQGAGDNIPKEASLCGNTAEAKSCDLLYNTPLYNSLDMGEWSEVEYSSLSEMLLAVNSSKADWLYVPHQTALYIQRQHPDMTLLVDGTLIYYYSMLTRDADGKLCQEIDGAIGEMKADGSLDALKEQYLYSGDDSVGGEIKMPAFAGAKTIKIGVTGDFPPMDYIAADGDPAGFNVALCAAIGEKLGMNIQLVSVTADARLTALAGGTVDMLFWQQGFGGSAKAFDGVCATQSYFRDYGAALTTKHPWEDIMKRYGLLIKGSNYQKATGELPGPIRNGTLDFGGNETESYLKYLNSDLICGWYYNTTDIEMSSYSSLSDVLLALKDDRLDCLYGSYETMKYIQKQNPQLTLAVNACYVYHYCMATREDDKALYRQINDAITAMKADGSLLKLTNQYIYNAKGESANEIKLPYFEGAQTIRVGVTGNVPPMDHIAADGTPAGFNVALLAAIAQRLQVNIELVNITSDARTTALSSGRIDAIFWLDLMPDFGKTEEMLVTQPYYTAYGALLMDDYPVEWVLDGLLVKGK